MMAFFYVLFLLIFGTLNTLTTKWQFNMESIGIDGLPKHFQKPWWGNFAMFAAMIVVLLVYLKEEQKRLDSGEADEQNSKEESLLEKEKSLAKPKNPFKRRSAVAELFSEKKLKEFIAVGLPAVLDLISSGLNFMGLLCISASVWQMLRGSMIVFSALLSIMFLDRKMAPFHWLGISLCVLGIFCVGSASVLSGSESADSKPESEADASEDAASSKAGIGLLLVMIAQVVQAGQCVAEERLLKNLAIPGTLVVAFEGIWGCLLLASIVFPLMDFLPGNDVGGVQENTPDTLIMIANSHQLQIMLVIYLISCSTYNIARMLVTSTMSAIHFTMIDCSRTALVWCIDLLLMYGTFPYGLDFTSFGETWDSTYSPLQALGFLILISGQCVYGGILVFPCFQKYLYPSMELEAIASLKYSRVASCRHVATPLPNYSPIEVQGMMFGGNEEDQTQYTSLGKDNAIAAQGAKGERVVSP